MFCATGLVFHSPGRYRQEVSRQQHVRILSRPLQFSVLGKVPDRLPEKAMLVSNAAHALALLDDVIPLPDRTVARIRTGLGFECVLIGLVLGLTRHGAILPKRGPACQRSTHRKGPAWQRCAAKEFRDRSRLELKKNALARLLRVRLRRGTPLNRVFLNTDLCRISARSARLIVFIRTYETPVTNRC